MTVPTSIITLNLSGQSGIDLAGARVTMKLTGYDIDSAGGGIVAPRLLEFETDENGSVDMDLWSNDNGTLNTQYEINVWHPITSKKILDDLLITIPTQDATISSILTGVTNIQPVAMFVLTPATGKAPISILFDGSASADPDGSIISYSWTVDNVVVGSGSTHNHTFSDGGTFTVGLVIIDNNGATHNVGDTISINPVIAPTAGFTMPSPITSGDTAVATDTSIAGDNAITVVEYDWGVGAGFVANASFLFATSGSYSVTQRVSDATGHYDTLSLDLTVAIGSVVDQATQSVAGLSTATVVSSFTVTPSSGATPLRVTVDPSVSEIVGWQAVKDQVDALPSSSEKTALLVSLQAMIDDLQFVFNYNA